MKSLIASIMVLGLVGLVVAAAVQAVTEASVAATVTVQNISVSVADGTVAYGTIGAGTSKSTLELSPVDIQTATNNGNVTENLNIRGQNSSPAGWTLAATAGANQYVHEFSKNSGGLWTALTTINQTLATGVASSGTQTFDLKITTPSSATDYTAQSVNVTVQATI